MAYLPVDGEARKNPSVRGRPSLSIRVASIVVRTVVSKMGQTGATETEIGSGWIVGFDKERAEGDLARNAFVYSLNRTRCACPVRGTLWDVAQDYEGTT